ncbi:AraC family transcriptional regulator, partial [bacterium]
MVTLIIREVHIFLYGSRDRRNIMSMQPTTNSISSQHIRREISAPPWRGVTVTSPYIPPHEIENYSAPFYTIDMHVSRPYRLEWKQNGSYRGTLMTPGDLCIAAAHEIISMRWRDHLNIISVKIAPSLVIETAEAMKLGCNVEIPELHGASNTQIAHLCHALWLEAEAGYPTGQVYGESISVALTTVLLQRFGIKHVAQSTAESGKLTPRCLSRVRDYIEANLERDISLEDLAQIARLSTYHFARCFKATVGSSPHQYI